MASIAPSALDIAAVRQEFPALHQEVHGRPLVYLDSAASTQRPRAVIDAVAEFYRRDHAHVHRGLYELSQRATDRAEARSVARHGGVAQVVRAHGS